MHGFEIEEIATVERLEAIVPAWAQLWQRAHCATPFQSPAWLIPWWYHIGRGELRVLAAHERGRLVGLLPMYRQRETEGDKLLPLGIAISDYLDGLFEPAPGPTIATAMLRHLVTRHRDWRVCELHPLPAGSALLEARVPACCVDEVLAFEPCPVLPVPAGARALSDVVPRRMCSNFRYFGRRAGKIGCVRFETAGAAAIPELLEALFELHAARWKGQGRPGVLADPAVQAFHRDGAPALLSAGLLRLGALRVDGHIAAVIYGLIAKRRGYYYVSGFNPELARISPGTLAIGHLIEQLIREGAREIDFLRGQERFKYFWGAKDRPSYGRMLRRLG